MREGRGGGKGGRSYLVSSDFESLLVIKLLDARQQENISRNLYWSHETIIMKIYLIYQN